MRIYIGTKTLESTQFFQAKVALESSPHWEVTQIDSALGVTSYKRVNTSKRVFLSKGSFGCPPAIGYSSSEEVPDANGSFEGLTEWMSL